jgi:neutral ceramidase
MSRARRFGFVALISVGCLSGCARTFVLDGQLSPQPHPRGSTGLRAGFGRADITPPAGVGLAGNGSEGRRAQGYRLRLYARAMLLEDPDGNRLALVVADLPLGSALLHRRVAALTAGADSIGVDRLVIAVTHTHSGPSHYFEGAAFNDQGSSIVGYDPVLLDSLAQRIAAAVHAAKLDLRDAKAAWGSRRIWGYTRIRSLPAMLRNLPSPVAPLDAPDSLPLEYRLVDPTLTMLRIDQRDPATGSYRPAGAFSVFAVHGTGNASATQLLDADIHGLVERRLEHHIDRDLNQHAEPSFVPRAFHLFANGAEGDVSPAWPAKSRCAVPAMAVWPLLAGPYTQPLWQWKPIPSADVAACLQAARRAVERIGSALGDEAVTLFDQIGGRLSDRLELTRAFQTLALRENAESLGICRVPAFGMSTFAGSVDAQTRISHWHPLGLLSLSMEQGAANPGASGCQGAKHQFLDVLFGSLPNKLAVSRKIPSFGQLSVIRIGNRLIGTIPGEVTTTAGRRMQESMLAALKRPRGSGDTALIMALTNGHIGYVTTAEEYAAQWYEGGSTLYGPGEAAMFDRALAGLAGSLSSGDVLPPASAPTLRVFPGTWKALLHPKRANSSASAKIERAWCSRDTLYVNYQLGSVHDWPAGSPFTATPNLEILRDSLVVGWDDDASVELHLRSLRRNPARWQLRWSGARSGSVYRIRLRGGQEGAHIGC